MLFVLIALAALTAGAGPAGAAPQRAPQPQQSGKEIPIIQLESTNNGDGSYSWVYETGNGIKANEEGQLKNAGSENEAISVQGQFSYTADDGTPIQVTYLADENGFQPQGAHLPTPPPIPEAILKALEYNAAHPEEDDQGQPGAAPPQRQPQRGRK